MALCSEGRKEGGREERREGGKEGGKELGREGGREGGGGKGPSLEQIPIIFFILWFSHNLIKSEKRIPTARTSLETCGSRLRSSLPCRVHYVAVYLRLHKSSFVRSVRCVCVNKSESYPELKAQTRKNMTDMENVIGLKLFDQ